MSGLPGQLPTSRVPDPRTAPPLRWGILGTGWIAERFVDALQRLTAQQVVAVGSRTPESARTFADRFGIATAHGSYADLVADDQVDVMYVATPHNAHLPHSLLAVDAGRHVLIEKPLALNAEQARLLATRADAAGVYCAEAFWSLFLPKFDVIRQVLDDGVLGEVTSVLADNGEWFAADHRIMRADLAGGPMLDLGTYPIGLATWVLGLPESLVARGTPAPSGVNGRASALLAYAGGAEAVISTTLFADTPTELVVAGSEATLAVPGRFYRPGPFTVTAAGASTVLRYDEPESMYDGLAYEAAETARRITAGELTTPVRPLAHSVATLTVMDEIRRQIGAPFADEL